MVTSVSLSLSLPSPLRRPRPLPPRRRRCLPPLPRRRLRPPPPSYYKKQGPDLIEPAADMKFGGMERRPRGPQAHGGLKYCGPMGAFLNVHF